MNDLDFPCGCGSGKSFGACCSIKKPVFDLNQYKLDQAEKDLRLKLVDFSHRPEIQAQIGEAFYIWKNDPELLAENLGDEDIDDFTFAKFFDWFIYDFRLIDNGKRVIERFSEEERFNIPEVEKSLLSVWLDNVYSFFEVEEVLPNEGCIIRDIFTGEVLKIKDLSSSSQIATHDIIGARPLKVGGNTYFSSVISVYSEAFKPLIIDFFNIQFKDYKRSFGRKSTTKDFLKDLGFLIGNYIEDIVDHPQFFTPDGDEFVFASAIYKVKNYERAVKKLQNIKSLEEIEGGTDDLRVFSWVRKRGKERVGGTIEVENDKLTIDCYSLRSLDKVKKIIEKNLNNLIEYKRDSLKHLDLNRDTVPNKTAKTTLPPGVSSKRELDNIIDEHYDEWIDKPHNVLKGKTPRQALETKQGRELLTSILNELEGLYERARERGEPYYDIGRLRKKLKIE
ncbi:MAG: hypothetical protein L0Y68_05405 [Candidatus Dadabacteria bacterium]|nr:hypothetical protein [Candidatus Dadabacteria bacterium]